ncbi:unnamed protein product, partial [marine sediment metagenome]
GKWGITMEINKDVFVSISKESHDILVRLRKKYGSNRNVVEKALRTLCDHETGQIRTDNPDDKLRLQLMSEFNTVLLDRSDFGTMLEGKTNASFDDALGRAYLKRIVGRNLSELSLTEYVELLRRCYSGVFNWVDNIYENMENGTNVVVFVHQFGEDYSEFLASYFSKMFEGLGFRTVEKRIRKKYFILDIRPGA